MPLSAADRQAFHQDPCLPGHPDPYPIYAALRAESPLQWCEGPGMWVVLGYPEAEACMRDPRLHRQEHLDKLIRTFGSDRIYQRQKLDVPYMDGDAHAKARQHVLAAFHAIDLVALRERCDQLLEEMVREIPRKQWLDLMPALAHPLPLLINSTLMGIPADQHQEVLLQVSPFVRARGLRQNESTARGGDLAMDAYRHFFLPLIEERRRNPQQDLLGRLVDSSAHGVAMGDEQLLLIIASNFYSASLYTVPLVISHLALILSRQPAIVAQLRQDPSLVDSAVEEVLRFDPPAQAINASAAIEPIELAGQRIAAGDSLTVLVGAANRDPRAFDQPDSFLLNRHPNPHLSFAPGLHQCLGLQLARLEVRAVLRTWLRHFERVEVDEEASRRLVADRFRGFEHLIVRFDPAVG